jgi:hypothetical protein
VVWKHTICLADVLGASMFGQMIRMAVGVGVVFAHARVWPGYSIVYEGRHMRGRQGRWAVGRETGGARSRLTRRGGTAAWSGGLCGGDWYLAVSVTWWWWVRAAAVCWRSVLGACYCVVSPLELALCGGMKIGPAARTTPALWLKRRHSQNFHMTPRNQLNRLL